MTVQTLPSSVCSPRLLMRLWEPEDAPALSKAVEESLDHLLPWMPWAAFEPLPLDARLALIDQWRREWKAGGDSVMGVFLDGSVIGGAGLHRRVGPGAVDVGYWIHAEHIRNGYATEAARALAEAALEVEEIDLVVINHDKANVASAAVARNAGFEFVSESTRDPAAPGELGIVWRWVFARTP